MDTRVVNATGRAPAPAEKLLPGALVAEAVLPVRGAAGEELHLALRAEVLHAELLRAAARRGLGAALPPGGVRVPRAMAALPARYVTLFLSSPAEGARNCETPIYRVIANLKLPIEESRDDGRKPHPSDSRVDG